MADIPLMAGKSVLVTGGTGGIGKATATGLAALGARVGITGRDQARTEAAAADIRAATGSPAVDAFAADMSVQAGVRRLAAQVAGTYPRLDVLVNNAGGFWAHRHLTADGLERTFALNHLAPFLLTNLLLDRLTASAPARVVTVSSGAHTSGRIDFDDLQGERNYSGQRAYSQSKLANVMFTYELARRLDGTGVTATVLPPRRGPHQLRRRRPGGVHGRHDPRGAPVHEDPGPRRGHPGLPGLAHPRSRASPAGTTPTANPRPPARPPTTPQPPPGSGRSAPAWQQPHSARRKHPHACLRHRAHAAGSGGTATSMQTAARPAYPARHVARTP